ncbi:50S ribosomal protein L5 [Candidatus Woesearchaeota archaeon]|nr:50S ribosomal protein L5 [Candidatus Woesearchaeota archaeon]
MNVMKNIKIEKITLNVGAGKDQAVLEKGLKLIKHITGVDPIKTFTNKRIPTWGLRPGLPIGCKLTLRGAAAEELLGRMLKAKNNKLSNNHFDHQGNVSFGVHEYIEIPLVKYLPELGLMGLQVCATLERPGYRVKKRRLLQRKVSLKHVIKPQESIEFMKAKYGISVEED